MSNKAKVKALISKLKAELKEKNEVLKLYADHNNWVKASEVTERLSIPETNIQGEAVPEPTQCFVGARYPWEPALKVMLGVKEEE